MSRTQGRDVAFKILFESDYQELAPEEALTAFEEVHGRLPRKTRAFALALVAGALEHKAALDARLSETARNWRLDRMGRVERSILRLGVYELLYGDVPTAVVIDEAVELAKRYAGEEAGAFVNGVLDAVHRGCARREAARG